MAQGKFSASRQSRDEERQIEEAFRQVTGRAAKKPVSVTPDISDFSLPNQAADTPPITPSGDTQAAFSDPTLSLDDDFFTRPGRAVKSSQGDMDFLSFLDESVPPTQANSQDDSDFWAFLDQPPVSPAQDARRSHSQGTSSGSAGVSQPRRTPAWQDEEDFYAFLNDTDDSKPSAPPRKQQPTARRANSSQRQAPGKRSPKERAYVSAQAKRAARYFEQEDEEEESGFWENLALFWRRNQKPLILGITLVALILVIGIGISSFLSTSDPYNNQILGNVYLADINVGGMTKSQATAALKQATDSYSQTDMVVSLGDQELRLSPANTGVRFRVNDAVNAAFAYGRTGSQSQQNQDLVSSQEDIHTIGLLPYLDLNTNYIRQTLDAYAREIGSTLTQPSYTLEGQQLNLATDQFDPNLSGQSLVVTTGTPGVGFDAATAYNEILDAYSLRRFQVYVDASANVQEPTALDLEALYQSIYVAPVSDSINQQTFQTIPGSYGVSFDMELARNLIANAGDGEIVRIPLVYTPPADMGDDQLFRDVLGECQTRHNENENRNNNLRLVCATLDGMILQPGEVFSYNDALGERTAEKGYKSAPAYSGTSVVNSIGGGICQGSSTLYNCVLLADLEVVERLCHGFTVGYLPIGLDATVSWGYADFKFRNTSNYPIMIKAEVDDQYMKMQILGVDEKDYYIKMESSYSAVYEPNTVYREHPADNPYGYTDGQVLNNGTTGYSASSYKVKYDKQTNQVISRTFEAYSNYITVDRVVVRIIPNETTDTPTPPPTDDPTVPPTTEAGGNTDPSQDTTPTTPTETTPTESTPTETTPTESTPTESTPTQTTPAESTPTEPTPTESTPTESTPTESTPAETAPTQPASPPESTSASIVETPPEEAA